MGLDLGRFVPLWFIEWLQDHGSGEGLAKARESAQLTTNIAKQLVDSKIEAIGDGKGKRDVFSLLGGFIYCVCRLWTSADPIDKQSRRILLRTRRRVSAQTR